jgi:hypothetical protein
MRRSKRVESGSCDLIHSRRGVTSNSEAGEQTEMAWSNGKSAIFDLKTTDLNGGFRLAVVGTRGLRSYLLSYSRAWL